MDVCILTRRPVYKRILLLASCQRAGVDVVIRSYLGRSTTRKFLRDLNLLTYVDDFIWNDREIPEQAYEITDPDDEIFEHVHAAGLATARKWLTSSLAYEEGDRPLVDPKKEVFLDAR